MWGPWSGQADDTIVFDHIQEHPGWHLVDQLFVNRKAQARVLGCHPDEVVKYLAEVLHRGPKPLQEVNGGPCQEKVYLEDEIDLSTLPIVRHTEIDPYPHTTGFALLAVLRSSWSNCKMAIAVDPDIDIYDCRIAMCTMPWQRALIQPGM